MALRGTWLRWIANIVPLFVKEKQGPDVLVPNGSMVYLVIGSMPGFRLNQSLYLNNIWTQRNLRRILRDMGVCLFWVSLALDSTYLYKYRECVIEVFLHMTQVLTILSGMQPHKKCEYDPFTDDWKWQYCFRINLSYITEFESCRRGRDGDRWRDVYLIPGSWWHHQRTIFIIRGLKTTLICLCGKWNVFLCHKPLGQLTNS